MKNFLIGSLTLSAALTILFIFIPSSVNADSFCDLVSTNNKGVRLFNKKEFTKAISALEKVVLAAPRYDLARENLATAYNNYALQKQANHQLAAKYFRRALCLSPTETVEANYVGYLRKMGKDPDSFATHLALAKSSEADGDIMSAYIEYKEALKIEHSAALKAKITQLLREGKIDFKGKRTNNGALLYASTLHIDPYFEEKDVDFGPYMRELQRRIKHAWSPPKSDVSKRVVVIFKVHKDGTLTNLKLATSSGVDTADEAALKAVRSNAQLMHLPKEACDDVDIQFTFDYNTFFPTPETTIAACSDAIKPNPKDVAAYLQRGRAYSDKDEYQKSIDDYSCAITLEPNSESYCKRGAAYGNLGQHKKAMEDFVKATIIDSKNPEAYFYLGTAYEELGQHQNAIKSYSKCVALDPKNAQAYTKLANVYWEQGEYQKVIGPYTKAIHLNAQNREAYLNRGESYEKLGEQGKAIGDYTKAIYLNPNDSLVFSYRASAYENVGKLKLAEDDRIKAGELERMYGGATSGWVYTNQDVRNVRIDKSGKRVTVPRVASIGPYFSEDLAAVKVREQWGFKNKSGKMVIKPQFEEALPFSKGLAIVEIDDQYGFIDHSGKMLIKPRFDQVFEFSEGLAPVQLNTKWGFIDGSGAIVIEPRFDNLACFREGLAPVKIDKKLGFIDKSGSWVIQPQFDAAESFSEGLAPVWINKKWGFIDRFGKLIIEPRYDQVQEFNDGLAAVEFNNKWGYIDKFGKIVISPRFNQTWKFQEGMAAVLIDKKWGFIDKSGKIVIKPQYDFAEEFSGGTARVFIDFPGTQDDCAGEELMCSMRYRKAIGCFSKAINMCPTKQRYCHRGDAYTLIGNYRQAINDYTKAISLRGNSAVAYAGRAKVYEKLGRKDLARRDAKKALALDYDNELDKI